MTEKRGIRSEQEGWIAVKWLRRYATRKMGEWGGNIFIAPSNEYLWLR